MRFREQCNQRSGYINGESRRTLITYQEIEVGVDILEVWSMAPVRLMTAD
jgi:hypothetical protein